MNTFRSAWGGCVDDKSVIAACTPVAAHYTICLFIHQHGNGARMTGRKPLSRRPLPAAHDHHHSRRSLNTSIRCSLFSLSVSFLSTSLLIRKKKYNTVHCIHILQSLFLSQIKGICSVIAYCIIQSIFLWFLINTSLRKMYACFTA